MLKKTINICITLDSFYVLPALVMLESLFESNKTNKFCFFVVVDDKSNKAYQILKKFIASNNASVSFYEVDKNLLIEAKTSNHITLASFYRLLLSDILPQETNKVLFLDCDLIVLSDLLELYGMNITSYELAAVTDNIGLEHKKNIGMSGDQNYFNAGVLLINLKRWREQGNSEKFLQYLKSNEDKIIYHDQDILNSVVEYRKEISQNWNVMESMHKEAFDNKLKDVDILHFTGSCKPWNCKENIFVKLYFDRIVKSKFKIIRKLFLRQSIAKCLICFKLTNIKNGIKQLIFLFFILTKQHGKAFRYYL